MDSQSIDIITKVLEQSAKLVEDEVDAKLSKLNEMDEDDMERLRERRLEALKKAQKQKQVCGTFSFNCFNTHCLMSESYHFAADEIIWVYSKCNIYIA